MSTTQRTKTTRRPHRRAQDRQEEMQALHTRLGAQIEALRDSAQWLAYLKFCAAFHHYSASNILLILSQCPQATQVAGYRRWQQMGRQVRKGEKGIRIWGGRARKVTEQDEQTDQDTTTRRAVVFFPTSVFDISQTDTMAGCEPVAHPARRLTGRDDHGIYDATAAHLSATGWHVSRDHLQGTLNGYAAPARTQDEGSAGTCLHCSRPIRRTHDGWAHTLPDRRDPAAWPRLCFATADNPLTDAPRHATPDPDTPYRGRVVVGLDLAPAQAAKTIVHEAGHVMLGHVQDDHDEYLAHRGRYEVEAESVAYVVAGALGLDTSDYSAGYVATWAQRAQADVIQATAQRVLSASRALLDALAPLEEPATDQAAA